MRLGPGRGSGKGNGYGFSMSVCVGVQGCLFMCIYMWGFSALLKRIVYGKLVKTSMFAGFAITCE